VLPQEPLVFALAALCIEPLSEQNTSFFDTVTMTSKLFWRIVKTSTLLRVYKVTSLVLLVPLILLPFIFRRNIIFATSATVGITFLLLFIALHVQRLQMLARTIGKLNELLELLRDAKRTLSPSESKQVTRELEQIRFCLLEDYSFRRWKSPPP
jgi:hypothetical protein